MRDINKGITFKGKHSYRDFGLLYIKRAIKLPNKNKIKSTVPFSNAIYDFSNLYGCDTYGERVLEFHFCVETKDIDQLTFLRMNIENWLMPGIYEDLREGYTPGYYFKAECENVDFTELYKSGEFKVTFNAYPFKIGEGYEGNNRWDSFNFELDALQDTIFTVNGITNAIIHNVGATDIEPVIMTTGNFEIVKDGKVFNVGVGESKDYRFKFKRGANNLTLKGKGIIEFRFRKEVL